MTRPHKKVMMICYFYPPTSNAGGERSAKFARYLPEHGWLPVVVAEGRADGQTDFGDDRVLYVGNLLWRAVWRVVRPLRRYGARGGSRWSALARSLDRALDTWLLVPDWAITWSPTVLPASWRLLRRGRAEAVYTTSPPSSSHLLGLALKRLAGRPWVMDLRDPWTIEPYNRALRASPARLLLERRLEAACFAAADAVILNTPEARERYATLYPRCAPKLHAIPNGFDAEELARARAALGEPTPWREVEDDVFVVSHVGKFFRSRGQGEAPRALLGALKRLLDDGTVSPANLRVILAGEVNDPTRRLINEFDLSPLVDTPGSISHFDAQRLMLASDLLVLFDPEGDGKTYVRSKLYEYLGADKPILGMVPEGASRELLRRSGRGLLVRPDDEESATRATRKAFESRENAVSPSELDLDAYERRRLAGDLASLLNDL